MQIKHLAAALCAVALTGSACAAPSIDEMKKQVAAAERAFAATMKARDFAAFQTFVADEAIFFNGPVALVGKDKIAAGWKALYEQKEAPFSWEPDQVEVIESGTLALSTGPVYSPDGKVRSRFNSVWRQEAPGQWKVVFDRGSPVCPPPKKN